MPTTSSLTSTKSALVHALQDIGLYLTDNIHSFPQFATTIGRQVVGPVLTLFLVTLVCLRILYALYRWFVPPSAKEYHRQALETLVMIDAQRDAQKYKKDLSKVERLLWRAIQRDPQWKPAFLSLAALYIYKLELPQAALKVLSHETCQKDAEFDSLRMDAQAMVSGNGSMVQGLLGQDEYLSMRAAELAKYK